MVLIRKVASFAAAASLTAVGVASADTLSSGLGMFAVAPDFNLGGSLAFYNLVSIVGVDGTVYGGQTTQDDGSSRHQVGASLGLNAELLDNLYPSIGATVTGAQTKRTVLQPQQEKCPRYHGQDHCPIGQRTDIEHEDARWGVEVKATYVLLDGWLGLTAGYRLTFDDPLGHQALFGASVVMRPRAP